MAITQTGKGVIGQRAIPVLNGARRLVAIPGHAVQSFHPAQAALMEPDEICGFEFDWFACDRDGYLALMSTAGSGLAPACTLAAPAERELLLQHFAVASPSRSEWAEFAELGLYVYDCGSMHDYVYKRVALPTRPLRLDGLPAALAQAASRYRFAELEFARTGSIDGRPLEPDAAAALP